MRIRHRLKALLFWSTVLLVTVAVGGLVSAYFYATDSETLAREVRREGRKYLPGCKVGVIKVRIRPFWGEVTLYHLGVNEPAGEDGREGLEVVKLPFVQVHFNPWEMLNGRFEVRDVALAKPTLRLRRRPDGTWNLQGLAANPWPGPTGGASPPIKIQDGTIELVGEAGRPPTTVLREVKVETKPAPQPGHAVAFTLEARGRFDRVTLEGAVEPDTGKLSLTRGDLVRLTISEGIGDSLPAPTQAFLNQIGLTGGEVDASIKSLTYDPQADPPLHYEATASLRRGAWQCPKMPFPLSDVSVDVRAADGRLEVTSAKGVNGSTSVDLRGSCSIDDPAAGPFQVEAVVNDLELDGRLRDWTPEKLKELWDVYCPQVGASPKTSAGRLNATLHASRAEPGAAVVAWSDIELLDVSMKYRHFRYPLDHVRGKLHWTPRELTLDGVSTLSVGGKPLKVSGKVVNPGREAVADLRFDVGSLPLDETLFAALPREVLKVFDDFKPTGTVKGVAFLHRDPPEKPGDDPRGKVKFDASIDLDRDCSITWTGLKYPVMNLTGQFEIHPDLWIFRNMRGKNGQASIAGAGEVRQVGRDQAGKEQFRVGMDLEAANLPFDQQLRDALPNAWQLTWKTLNPTGASDIKARIDVVPGQPEHYRIEIKPRESTGVNLRFNPMTTADAPPAGPLELRMDDATGRFVYDTAVVPPTSMSEVGFTFHSAPVTFARGQVDVRDTGQFALQVDGLEVTNLRLDEGVRRLMPPVMANFARRLDDRKLARMKGDLSLGWSGKAGDTAYCEWKDGLVVLDNNKAELGTDMALDHVQGEFDNVRGKFDGRDLDVHGRLDLDSISLFDQRVTRLRGELDVSKGIASLTKVQGKVLGGTVNANLEVTLDATPHYSVTVGVDEADLHAYARSLNGGNHNFKGLITGWATFSGSGYDVHTITGSGCAKVVQGDLGTLPVALRFLNALKLAKDTRTAFDSAEVQFKTKDGETVLNPVLFSGNALSLDGFGTLDVRGDLDIRFRILAGRDRLHIPVVSDATRELSGQFFIVRVFGPVGSPTIKPEPFPWSRDPLHNRNLRPAKGPASATPTSWRTGLESRARGGLGSLWRGGE